MTREGQFLGKGVLQIGVGQHMNSYYHIERCAMKPCPSDTKNPNIGMRLQQWWTFSKETDKLTQLKEMQTIDEYEILNKKINIFSFQL